MKEQLAKDIERIQQLSIVPSILELVCRTTGMGFAAVARVTEDKWIACAVKDEIEFGLRPGGELQLESTICNEIRGHGQPVVIDEVSKDELFCNHHTPKQYGFQSYISIPIILKDGSFFGTLCAIDPRPFSLKSSNMVTLFTLFADLISYHLLSEDEIRLKNEMLVYKERQLQHISDEVRQYSHISHHTLQEPLRKIRLFTDQLITLSYLPEQHKAKEIALKVSTLAGNFSSMITQLTDFSDIDTTLDRPEVVDLNTIVNSVLNKLRIKVENENADVNISLLHTIYAIPEQMSMLFYHLISNALSFTRPGIPPVIRISSKELNVNDLKQFKDIDPNFQYCQIDVEDNGSGIANNQLDRIFDLFARLQVRQEFSGFGIGLSQAKKIVRNHGGIISVASVLDAGSVFSVILPIDRKYLIAD